MYRKPSKYQNRARAKSENEKFLDALGIPNSGNYVIVDDLVDILKDEKKFQELKSKIALKAFW